MATPEEEVREDLTDPEAMITLLETLPIPEREKDFLRREIRLSRALQDKLHEVIKQAEANGKQTMASDEIARQLNEVAEQMGFHYGIPLPDLTFEDEHGHQLVMADRVPLSWVLRHNETRTWAEEYLRARQIVVRNSWHMLGDRTVCVVETERGPMAFPQWDAGSRFRTWFDTAMLRSRLPHISAESELRAQNALKQRINQSQFDSYVLNGMFPERSKKSKLHYIFRKGLPTVVLTTRNRETGEEGNMRCLCALCFHPMGYYTGTHCGIMCPTDEVIAQLLMMRADEHRFWKMSGQWAASDPRSGL